MGGGHHGRDYRAVYVLWSCSHRSRSCATTGHPSRADTIRLASALPLPGSAVLPRVQLNSWRSLTLDPTRTSGRCQAQPAKEIPSIFGDTGMDRQTTRDARVHAPTVCPRVFTETRRDQGQARVEAACRHCGAKYPKSAPNQEYCSGRCKQRAYWNRRLDRLLQASRGEQQ